MRQIIIIGLFLCSTLIAAFAAEPPTVVTIDTDGVQRVEILAGDYFFKPAHLIVKVNQPVELKIRKETYIVPHNIIIDAPAAGIKVNEALSRDLKTIAFTPTKIGAYPIFCDKKPPFLASHREKGMEGVLEVVE